MSPWGWWTLVKDTRILAPILKNLEEYQRCWLGSARTLPFVARIRDGPEIEFPPVRGPEISTCGVPMMIHETWVEHVYTPSTFHVGEHETVVDLGANIGVFTLFAALITPRGRVVSYEPDPDTFAILLRNIDRNRVSNVETIKAGVLDRRGPNRIWHDSHNVGGHSIYPLYVGASTARSVSVDFVTLEDVLELNHLKEIGLLKIDCEGAEYRILGGAADDVLRRVQRIVVECQPVPEPGMGRRVLAQRLRSLGFQVRVQPTKVDAGMLWASR
jgi:FkbM family methyltransferase